MALFDNSSSCTNKICIEAKRVFDACIKQISEEETRIDLNTFSPPCPALPLTFVSGKSLGIYGSVEDLTVTLVSSRPRCGRVQCNVVLPIEVSYIDNNGVAGSGVGEVTIPVDIIMNIPQPSIIPYQIEAVISALCPTGEFSPVALDVTSKRDCLTFYVHLCASIIIKVTLIVDIVIPYYAYAQIPPCTPYSAEVCSGFFELPLFPQANP